MKSANELVTEWCTNGDNIFEYYFSVLLQIAKRASDKHGYSVGIELRTSQDAWGRFLLQIPANRDYKMEIYPLITDIGMTGNTLEYARFPGTEDGVFALEEHLHTVLVMGKRKPNWDNTTGWDYGKVVRK
jgi:hypothetical protein